MVIFLVEISLDDAHLEVGALLEEPEEPDVVIAVEREVDVERMNHTGVVPQVMLQALRLPDQLKDVILFLLEIMCLGAYKLYIFYSNF